MPTGLKQSSSLVSIGFSVPEAGPNTFTQGEVDLNLSPLDREVFVVLAVNIDPESPDAVAGQNTATNCSLLQLDKLQFKHSPTPIVSQLQMNVFGHRDL